MSNKIKELQNIAEPIETLDIVGNDTDDKSDNAQGQACDDTANVPRMVPLKALEAERRKYKDKLDDPELKATRALADKLKSTFGRDISELMSALDGKNDTLAEELGLSPKAVEYLAAGHKELAQVKAQLKKQARFGELYDMSHSDFYADAPSKRAELEQYADEHNCDMKAAYNALFVEKRYRELLSATHEDILRGIEKKREHRIDAVYGGDGNGGVMQSMRLSPEQLEIAKAYGMSAEEYAKYSRS